MVGVVALREMVDAVCFIVILYAAYACMLFGPTDPLRRWGGRHWLGLALLGPGMPSLRGLEVRPPGRRWRSGSGGIARRALKPYP